MEKNKTEKDFKKTQSTSSPGALGEDLNRDQKKPTNPISNLDNETSKEEGLNEQKSSGNAGAYEGFENTEES